ncbi:MAG: HD domain-containing protein [Defluviitaleaceae bacterium]|nr:HD domain-containing protein [Defluviitaleaceae bacterium]MCL2261756.1 HD domain-containing protein [Defluviitaleaceae bacterium]
MRYIKELRENERIIEHYLCKKKESKESRAGKTFLSLRLQDKTGSIDAKVWEITKDIGQFEEGDVVKIDGTVGSYMNEPQLKVVKLRRSTEGEYIHEDFIPTTEKDVGEMFGKVSALIKGAKNTYIKALLENIFIKNEELAEIFKSHSAAMHMHHSYMGGLLEHTLSVAETCMFLGGRYKYVNMDLLLAGALLHDIGKIYELSPMPQNEYTDDGQMLGHIVLGLEMVSAEIAKIDGFPHELASLIKHCIVAHHGEFEFGSPKIPAIPEAMILHFADNIDAKLTTFGEIYEKDTAPGLWTTYQKSLGRYIRKPVNV